jgi:Arc/MetJ-type ribon-helix-helix transcriptional regulator
MAPNYTTGVLAKYAKLVSSASQGGDGVGAWIMARIEISLPDDVFQAVDRLRRENKAKLTMSQFCRYAIIELLKKDADHKRNQRDLEEFFAREETEEELMEWVHQASLLTLAKSPWGETSTE